MPNWCSNLLTLKGLDHDVKQALADLTSGATVIHFAGLLPLPEDLQHTSVPPQEDTGLQQQANAILRHKYGFSDWYNWKLRNWGTKAQPEPDNYGHGWHTRVFKNGQTHTSLAFSTAWSPPTAFVRALARKHSGLAVQLTYEEGGNCFAGEVTWKSGQQTAENTGDKAAAAIYQRCKRRIKGWYANEN